MHLCENTHFTYKILQYTCFNYMIKCVWDMSKYNKLSDIEYARFQILPVDLYFWLFWSAGISTVLYGKDKQQQNRPYIRIFSDKNINNFRNYLKKIDCLPVMKESNCNIAYNIMMSFIHEGYEKYFPWVKVSKKDPKIENGWHSEDKVWSNTKNKLQAV